MAEYIEREAALESVRQKLLISESLPDSIAKRASVFTLASMNDSLKSIPAADVRPVVLCRECVHWERYDNTAGCGYCHKVKFEYGADGYVFNPVRAPDFYCADGRKADV